MSPNTARYCLNTAVAASRYKLTTLVKFGGPDPRSWWDLIIDNAVPQTQSRIYSLIFYPAGPSIFPRDKTHRSEVESNEPSRHAWKWKTARLANYNNMPAPRLSHFESDGPSYQSNLIYSINLGARNSNWGARHSVAYFRRRLPFCLQLRSERGRLLASLSIRRVR